MLFWYYFSSQLCIQGYLKDMLNFFPFEVMWSFYHDGRAIYFYITCNILTKKESVIAFFSQLMNLTPIFQLIHILWFWWNKLLNDYSCFCASEWSLFASFWYPVYVVWNEILIKLGDIRWMRRRKRLPN